MKRLITLATLLLLVGMNAPAQSHRFKKTKTGLQYRFEERNRRNRQPAVGDILVGELTMIFGTDTLFSNIGEPTRIFQVSETQFPGDINEGLLMMHKGDKACFATSADSLASKVGKEIMPPSYEQGANQKITYIINLIDILTPLDIARINDSIAADKQRRKEEEPTAMSKYIKDNYQSIEMTANGLYIYTQEHGNGPTVQPGRTIQVDYTGRLLDGKVFDTSNDSIARAAGIYNPKRNYAPLSYTVGKVRMIAGWEQGLLGLPEGTRLTLIIPSSLGYGERGAGNDIPPYASLIFDIKILKVE